MAHLTYNMLKTVRYKVKFTWWLVVLVNNTLKISSQYVIYPHSLGNHFGRAGRGPHVKWVWGRTSAARTHVSSPLVPSLRHSVVAPLLGHVSVLQRCLCCVLMFYLLHF